MGGWERLPQQPAPMSPNFERSQLLRSACEPLQPAPLAPQASLDHSIDAPGVIDPQSLELSPPALSLARAKPQTAELRRELCPERLREMPSVSLSTLSFAHMMPTDAPASVPLGIE